MGPAFLYRTAPGRALLRLLRARWVSRLAGAFLDTPLSRPLIGPFVRRNGIDLSQCERTDFRCFNDCFTRTLRPELRPFDPDPAALCAPCDGLLTVCPIDRGTVLSAKGCDYTAASLLRDASAAEPFNGGHAFIFRLCVDHCHRYAYPASGSKGPDTVLDGTLHTVRPVALARVRVFCENSRRWCRLDCPGFGPMVQMEVGAMLVGRIENRMPGPGSFAKGAEKGMFLYGGSTVILLTGPDVVPRDELLGPEETPVRMGERINK